LQDKRKQLSTNFGRLTGEVSALKFATAEMRSRIFESDHRHRDIACEWPLQMPGWQRGDVNVRSKL
jgi:hypothetical protein